MLQRIGRYEILETLAGGGQGTVYLGREDGSEGVVAIKVMHPGHTGEALYLDALRREANLATRLEHPNVTQIQDFQIEDGAAYLVMEYVPDVLSNHISPETPLPAEMVAEIGREISLALSHAHSYDVVHRDIKPQNILLTEDGTVKVTDFGIARAMEASTMSRTGVMGTPFYMSPEQWAGGRVDGRADVYSLGILLYELLTGSPPFQGEGMGDVYRQHVEEAVPPFNPDLEVPQWLQTVVLHCLEKDREDRFQSPDDLVAAIDAQVQVRVVTALLPRRLPLKAIVSMAMGGGVFAGLSIGVAALATSGGGTSVLLALLVLIAGIGALASTYGIATWVRRRRRTRFWVSGALSVGVLALIVGGLTFVDPALTGLTGRTEPQVAGPEVFMDVPPDIAATIEAPTGDVTIEIPAGATTELTRFYYARIEQDTAPKLPDGYIQTERVFDLSVLDGLGEKLDGVTFEEPLQLTIQLTAQDVYNSQGDPSLILIQHYHEEDGWEVLPTEVYFTTATATASIERLSIFALTVKEPEELPEPTPTPEPFGSRAVGAAISVPTPTSIPTAVPTPTPEPAPTPEATAVPVVALPTEVPTPTPIPTPTRPDVEGYLLKVNGEYFPGGSACMKVTGGEICVFPKALPDGSFKKRSELTIVPFPDQYTHQIKWPAVGTVNHGIFTTAITSDVNILMSMIPEIETEAAPILTPTPLPTQEPIPLQELAPPSNPAPAATPDPVAITEIAPSIRTTTRTVAPNSQMILMGTGFLQASGQNLGPRSVSGFDESIISLAGIPLAAPYVQYPIEITDNGSIMAKVVVPPTVFELNEGTVTLTVTDDRGVTASTDVELVGLGASVSSEGRYPNEKTELAGRGFRANQPNVLTKINSIDAIYMADFGEYYVEHELGRVEVDARGEFQLDFVIPGSALIPSTNQIVLTSRAGEQLKLWHFIPSREIEVIPTALFPGGQATVTIRGMPSSYPISHTMVSMGDANIGKDISGKRLITNQFGEISWTIVVPDISVGSHEVKFTDGVGVVTGSWVTLRAGTLELAPYLAIRGQTVFAKSTSFLGHGGTHTKSITDKLGSGVWIKETRLRPPDVAYPIRIPRDREVLFPIRLKPESIPREANSLQIKAVERNGMVAAGSILVAEPVISVSPSKGIKGSEITVSGTDFVLGKDPNNQPYKITIQYGETVMGSLALGKNGGFKRAFIVPAWASPGSTDLITAEIESLNLSSSASHTVPGTELSIYPQVPEKGGSVIITGTGYPPSVPLHRVYFSATEVHPPRTIVDRYGNFSVSIRVPQNVRANDVKLTVSTQYFANSYVISTIN